MYVDDQLVSEDNRIELGKGVNEIPSPSSGGLYIGGLPFIIRDNVDNAGMAGSVNGFVGTISDLAFIDDT